MSFVLSEVIEILRRRFVGQERNSLSTAEPAGEAPVEAGQHLVRASLFPYCACAFA